VRVVDNEQGARSARVCLREVPLRGRADGLRSEVRPREAFTHRAEELVRRLRWVVETSDRHALRAHQVRERPGDGGLAGADVTGQHEGAGAAKHGTSEPGQDLAVGSGEPGYSRARAEP
jgi:hypothetical protein